MHTEKTPGEFSSSKLFLDLTIEEELLLSLLININSTAKRLLLKPEEVVNLSNLTVHCVEFGEWRSLGSSSS